MVQPVTQGATSHEHFGRDGSCGPGNQIGIYQTVERRQLICSSIRSQFSVSIPSQRLFDRDCDVRKACFAGRLSMSMPRAKSCVVLIFKIPIA
jgi:hypothetical protein